MENTPKIPIPKISNRDINNVEFAMDNKGKKHSEEVVETVNNSINRFCTWMNESMEFLENDESVKKIQDFVEED